MYTCDDRKVVNQPKTPIRAVRIDDDLWDRVKRAAARNGETASDVVRRGLEEYVTANPEP